MILLWLKGLVTRRPGQLAGVATGIAVAVALLASIGSFIASADASMTARAASGVAVDWQVQLEAGGDHTAAQKTISAAPGVTAALPVGYAKAEGFSATSAGSTQSTGSGVIVGVPHGYASTFPGEIRVLTGSQDGVLLAQQTASNLHAAPGDAVTVSLADGRSVDVAIAGVVDLPQADSLFQTVGAARSAQPNAPPDNVLLVPADRFASLTDPLATARPDLVTAQVHVARSHTLPTDPAAAFMEVTEAANNLEAKLAGAGKVGNNLGAALDAARSDASYARVLFLFLGLPGAVLAAMLTVAVAGATGRTRRREQALLRLRGASLAEITRMAVAESAVVGILGCLAGIALAIVAGLLAFGGADAAGLTTTQVTWGAFACVAGLFIAALAVALPTVRDFRFRSVVASRRRVDPQWRPRWLRYGGDVLLIAGAAIVFAITTQTGYSLVLAPEGVPTINVNYWAFLGPALLWVGAGLLTWRLVDLLLRRGRGSVSRLVRPLAGSLASTAASTFSRQRAVLARSVVLLALALAFAASTATFNSTYAQQAEVDALLTNGSDVRVTEPPGSAVGVAGAATLKQARGVASVEPIQHRFAYVGTDLQDLFGVNPGTVLSATALQNAYFRGGSAADVMGRLAQSPDAILVSQETVKDYQLNLGDALNLRLRDGRTGALTTVPFHYAGIALEFPTAPHDSFLIANSSYVAQQTGNDAVGEFLIRTDGTPPDQVATDLTSRLGTSAKVTPIGVSRSTIGSSLTSVSLAGLTRLELAFALVLAAAAGGLVLFLGLADRRKTFAVATVLGASRRHLRGLVLSEGAIVAVCGLIAGGLIGWALSGMLVAVLTGVFDPAPSQLAVPWAYLAAVALVTVAGITAAALSAVRRSTAPAVESLRQG